MQLLFVTNTFPNPREPTRGMFNFYTARALARTHRVTVVAPVSWRDEWRLRRSPHALARRRTSDGVEIYHPRYYYPPGILRPHYDWFLGRSLDATVRDVLSRVRPDLLFSFWVHPDGAVAVEIASRLGVPAVVMAGGSDVLVLGHDAARRARIAATLQRADAVVCVSHHLKAAIEALEVPAGKIHVVRNGVDSARFCPGDRMAARRQVGISPNDRVFVWVGRMVPVKGLDVLIHAFAESRPLDTGSILCLIGDGPLKSALAAQAAALGISERVRCVGSVTHDQLAAWYRAADATVLPSRSEGSPNVLIESAACGTPFIASAVGGIPELAEVGLDTLVPADDAGALAAALRRYALDPPRAGRQGRPVTWDDQAAALERVFAGALEARRS